MMSKIVFLLVFCSASVVYSAGLSTPPPRVTPERFVDDGRQFAVFTCHSEGRHRDLLSWYQRQGNVSSLLVMEQFLTVTSTAEMQLVLNKTLTTSDQDTWIYCVRRTDHNAVTSISDSIYLNFSRVMPNVNHYITVQPASEVATFYVNTTRSFECGGSQPADGRSFNWYIEDVPSSNKFSHAPAQNMGSNPITKKVYLTLDLNESYHLKRIYCVQEYHMNLESSNGYYYWNYGEKARSNEILLSMISEDQFTDVSDNFKNASTVSSHPQNQSDNERKPLDDDVSHPQNQSENMCSEASVGQVPGEDSRLCIEKLLVKALMRSALAAEKQAEAVQQGVAQGVGLLRELVTTLGGYPRV